MQTADKFEIIRDMIENHYEKAGYVKWSSIACYAIGANFRLIGMMIDLEDSNADIASRVIGNTIIPYDWE